MGLAYGGRLLVSSYCHYPPLNFVAGAFALDDQGPATVASWDGLKWTPLGSGIETYGNSQPPITSIAASMGSIFFAGPFLEAGGKLSVGIARWDGLAAPVVSVRPWLSEGRPNPFVTASDFTFHLSRPATVRISVHDVQGREICLIDDSYRPAGDHTARWSGQSRAGVARAGIYFLVVRDSNGRLASRRVVKLYSR